METIKIGDKIVPISGYEKNGLPIIKSTTEEIRYPDGRVDVIVHVPCIKIYAKKEEI